MPRITTHPGEMLYQEFMVPLDLSARELARRLDVPPNRISSLVKGQRGMSADTAIRLEKALGMPAAFWMRLQDSYDLSRALTQRDYSGIRPIPTQAA